MSECRRNQRFRSLHRFFGSMEDATSKVISPELYYMATLLHEREQVSGFLFLGVLVFGNGATPTCHQLFWS